MSSANVPPGWLVCVSTQDLAETAIQVVAAGGIVVQPTAEVAPGGLFAVFADNAGAVFGGWQKTTFAGAQVAGEPGAVSWSDLLSYDQARSEEFYGAVFGWTTRPGDPAVAAEYSEWVTGGRSVAGVSPMPAEMRGLMPAGWQPIFEVDSHAETIDRSTRLGGQVVLGPIDVHVGWYTRIVDPQGSVFAFIEMIPELRAIE